MMMMLLLLLLLLLQGCRWGGAADGGWINGCWGCWCLLQSGDPALSVPAG